MMPGKNISGEMGCSDTVGCLPVNCELKIKTGVGGMIKEKKAQLLRVRYRNSLRTTAATCGDSALRRSGASPAFATGRATAGAGAAVSLSCSPRYCAAKRCQRKKLNTAAYSKSPSEPARIPPK